MKKYDVVILTDHRYVNDSPTEEYIHNVYLEDDILKKSLEKSGLKVSRKSWDDPIFDWSTASYLLFRTTWDYFDRFDEFSNWLDIVSKNCQLLNSKSIIYWNIDKHYLLDLKHNGVPICETLFIEKGDQRTLQEIISKTHYSDLVLKPCVSGAARETYRIKLDTITNYEDLFSKLITNESMMIQPFQRNIVEKGEVSLMVMNGKFTHAILKIAKPGDFRVQDDYGGTVHEYQPSREEIEFAEYAVKSCPEIPIYARVDVFLDNQNELALAELELIEPELWFRYNPESADELAKGIHQKIQENEEIF